MYKQFYGYHKIDNKDFKEINKALKGKFITNGNYVKKFEKALSSKLNSKFSITCNNGTSALYLAIKSLNLKKNSYVLIPSINFLSSSNIIKQMGHKIIFVDVDEKNGLVTPELFLKVLNNCKQKKIKPKLFIPQFHAGQTHDCKKIFEITRKEKIFLIEDACHAFGGKYQNLSPIGSCEYADLSTFSFHPVKNITTGEGGLVTTKSKILFEYIKKIRNHGIESTKKKSLPYKVNNHGLNFRLSDINCALGYSQLKKLSAFRLKKDKLYNYYEKKLKNIKRVQPLKKNNFSKPFWHLFIIRVQFLNWSEKEKFMKYLEKYNIGTQIHYVPIYKHKVFSKEICFSKRGSEKYFKSAVTLPFHLNLTYKDIDYITLKIDAFLNRNK